MKPITYEPSAIVEDALEEYLKTKTEDLLRLPPQKGMTKGVMTYNTWRETPEGRLHLQLLARYAIETDNVNARRVNAIQLKLQAQGRETKGRPRMYDSRKASLTHLRQIKLYLIDCLIAKALGLDPSEIQKPFEVAPVRISEPKDIFDALSRFEKWTGITLPSTAWSLYTKEERAALHELHPDIPYDDGMITLRAYKQLKTEGYAEHQVPSTTQDANYDQDCAA